MPTPIDYPAKIADAQALLACCAIETAHARYAVRMAPFATPQRAKLSEVLDRAEGAENAAYDAWCDLRTAYFLQQDRERRAAEPARIGHISELNPAERAAFLRRVAYGEGKAKALEAPSTLQRETYRVGMVAKTMRPERFAAFVSTRGASEPAVVEAMRADGADIVSFWARAREALLGATYGMGERCAREANNARTCADGTRGIEVGEGEYVDTDEDAVDRARMQDSTHCQSCGCDVPKEGACPEGCAPAERFTADRCMGDTALDAFGRSLAGEADAECGDTDTCGHFALVRGPFADAEYVSLAKRCGCDDADMDNLAKSCGMIVHTDSAGFVGVRGYTCPRSMSRDWARCQRAAN